MLFRGRQKIIKEFDSGTFLLPTDNYSGQSKQSEQPERSSDYQYTLAE